ncbi:MAG: membrane-bound lytic murein transglycosylase MltF [Hydrogenophilaceae bacterium]|nr:membrane-bound lytic murein transglycosylase MltF [Hydrogenophilaceae bacterium]
MNQSGSQKPGISSLLRSIGAALLVLQLAACGPKPIESPEQSGTLVVVTRGSPATYYISPSGQPTGFEYDLLSRFAEANGWQLRVEPVNSLDELFERIDNGTAHIAAAGLSATPARDLKYTLGPKYAEVTEQLICRSEKDLPKRPKDLAGKRIEVVANSSHVDALWWLRLRHPTIKWSEIEAAGEDELLERVQSGLSDCTVADSTAFSIARHFYPDIGVALELGKPRSLVWMMPKNTPQAFAEKLADFFAAVKKSGDLKQLQERYFGHIARLEEADVRGILERRTSLLSRYKPHFYRAQIATGIDWRFLAALAYQESHWDPNATSPTGVRGMMMLTAETADRLGVKNRLDPLESILGGAKYVLTLKEGLPVRIAEPDRTWLALAAYNVGMAHLEDARRLTASLGKNPDAWKDVKDVLPLLAQSAYQDQLKFGYARGGEARHLTENVRIYYDILLKYEPAYRD